METGFTTPAHLSAIPEHDLPPPRPPRAYGIMKTVAAVAMLIASLGLIALGGCFLIGVMEVHLEMGKTPEQFQQASFLVNTLYVLAFACFAGAIVLLLLGVWGLLKVLSERFITK